MERTQEPSPASQPKQVRDVLTAVAARLARTPSAALGTTDLRGHINDVVYYDHPDTHPDQLCPAVRAAMPHKPDDVTCGAYAALLRDAVKAM